MEFITARMRYFYRRLAQSFCFGCVMILATSAIAATPQKPVDVYSATAKLRNIPKTLNAVGNMKAIKSVSLSFDAAGTLTHIYQSDGKRVKQGELIAQLDDQTDLAQLKSYQASLQLTQSTYQRMQSVVKFGAVSQQMLDAKHAEMVQAQAQVQQQKVLISKKQLKAPFSGVLGTYQFSTGAYISKGTPVVKLVQEAPLKVAYTIPASDRSELEIGQSVTVESSAYPDKKFTGIVSYISPEVNQGSGTVNVEAKVDNPDFLLLPGMFVSVIQTLQEKRALLMIPDIALMTDINGQYVYKIGKDNIVSKTYVKAGILADNRVQILSGLKANDVIVAAGQQKLSDGDHVNILQASLPGSATQSSVQTKAHHQVVEGHHASTLSHRAAVKAAKSKQ